MIETYGVPNLCDVSENFVGTTLSKDQAKMYLLGIQKNVKSGAIEPRR